MLNFNGTKYHPEQEMKMKPILFVFHEKDSAGGFIDDFCRILKRPILVCRPRFGDKLPSFEEIQSAIIFGGKMSVNDTLDWKKKEMEWIEKSMLNSLPMLGICLGAQMMAHILGESICPIAQEQIECGYYPIKPIDKCMSGISKVYHWHRERFDLPKGATLLAQGQDVCPIQAFKWNQAIGVQFHPEIKKSIMLRWSMRDKNDLEKPGARPLETHFHDHDIYHASVQKWLQFSVFSHLDIK